MVILRSCVIRMIETVMRKPELVRVYCDFGSKLRESSGFTAYCRITFPVLVLALIWMRP